MRDQLITIFDSLGTDLLSRKNRFTYIMTEFYERMYADPMIGLFFANHELSHLVKQQVGFFMNAAGLTERFEGKGPATAHLRLPPILPGHFDRRIVLLRETLATQQVPIQILELWVAYEEAFRDMVVKYGAK